MNSIANLALSARELLKIETAKNHQEIETKMSFMKPDLSFAEYTDQLKRFYGFYAGFESQVSTNLEISALIDWGARKKVQLIEQDLAALDFLQTEKLSTWQPLQSVNSNAEILGALYVIEGSTLGGQFIFLNLKKTLNLSAERGASFFAGYGSKTGQMWRSFVEVLDSHVLSKEDKLVALKSAQNTFDEFGEWLSAV